MKTKFIAYLIVILIVLVFVILEIAIQSNEEKQEPATPEISEYERNRMQEQTNEIAPSEFAPFINERGEDNATDFAEVEPQFPGGESEMIQFIQQNVSYPEYAREMGEQGTVYVQFVVNTDGEVQNEKILKGVSASLDKEALRVVRKMPNWNPGLQDGEPVRVRYQLPIKFKIE